MGDKINNVGAMLNNPRQRNIYLMAVGLAIVAIVVGVMYASGGSEKTNAPSGAEVASIPDVQAVPGTSESSRYNKKVEESNALAAEKALAEGTTFVATPVNKESFSTDSPIDELDKQMQSQKEQEALELAEKQAAEQQAQQQAAMEQASNINVEAAQHPSVQLAQVVSPPKPPKEYGSDEDYILLSVLTGMSGAKNAKPEFNFTGQKAERENTESVSRSSVQDSSQSQGQAQPTKKGVLVAKSGVILNAILETGINSDEPSPVLAKIVSGDLKGTRLIGKINQVGEKVVVQFSTASIPNVQSSLPVNVVAVDPTTRRTALVSDVDRHYFLRYGVMLGAAFLGSYADALANKNSTVMTTPEGAIITTNSGLTSREINQQALGGVGKELASDTRNQISNLRPTITVNAGIPIGILIMEDMYLPK